MNGKAKNKVVTSGRLAGAGTVDRLSPNVVPAARPDPAYSLYSTDSEDQVTCLHKGLDHCAALLNGILQADNAASPDLSRNLKTGATKSRPSSTSQGKKSTKKLSFKTASPFYRTMKVGAKSRPLTSEGKTTMKKLPTKTVLATNQQSSQSGLHGPGRSAPRTPRQLLQRHNLKSPNLSDPDPPPQPDMTFRLPAQLPTSPTGQTEGRSVSEHTHCESERGEELVPVRDTNIQRCAESQPAVSCTVRMSSLQLETRQEDKIPAEEESCDRTEEKMKTVQGLLGDLRTLISGEDSEAERLLSHLEQVVSSPQLNINGLNIPAVGAAAASLQEIYQEEKTLCNSEELQDELLTAQSRLQELQNDLAELRKALQDTQNQLQNTEVENSLIKKDLELTRSRLLESEREKLELAALSQKRLEEMGKLERFIQMRCYSDRCDVDENSVTEHFSQHTDGQDPAELSADLINRYLMSLSEVEPTHMQPVCTAAPQQNLHPKPSSVDDTLRCGRPFSCTSQCDGESVWSYRSMKSGSTFNTRDEAAFRDGLAALDASIASLQKTIQLDLKK